MVTALVLACALQRPMMVKPPELATADGITVGLTTVQQFERKYGKGLVHVGGHSNGGRYWYDEAHHCVIESDGFDFAARMQEIIDFLRIEFDSKSKFPAVQVPAKNLGFLAKVHPGMSRSQVEKALHVKLTNDSVRVSGLVLYSKSPGNKDNNRFTTWQVNFEFDEHGLLGFEISAD